MKSEKPPVTTLSIVKYLRRSEFLRVFMVSVMLAYTIGCVRGPSQEEINAFVADKPPELQPAYADLLRGGNRDYVLNHMEIGLAALDQGYVDLAANSFDRAIEGIETVYSNSEEAQSARSLWEKEGSKDFKGEPYERAMAYLYRGLIYLSDGDYGNARSCFRRGQVQDAFAFEQQFESDMRVLWFLEGWASHLMGDTQERDAAWEIVRELQPDFDLPDEGDNTIVLVELGRSPIKYTVGAYDQQLAFAPGNDFADYTVTLQSNDNPDIYKPSLSTQDWLNENLYFQASSRGGREFDTILHGQAQFKEGAKEGGKLTAIIGGGIFLAGVMMVKMDMGMRPDYLPTTAERRQNTPTDGAMTMAGLIVMGVGALVMIVGGTVYLIGTLVRPEADDRFWSNLPNSVMAGSIHLDSPSQSVTPVFCDIHGVPLHGFQVAPIAPIVDPNGWGLVWVRSRSALEELNRKGNRRFDPPVVEVAQ